MRLTRGFKPTGTRTGDACDMNARRHGRINLQEIACDRGSVLDLSCSGMRLLVRGKVPPTGQIFLTRLTSVDEPIEVGCRVRWWRKAGFFTKEIGVEFVNLTPSISQSLTKLARQAAHNETFRQEIAEARRKA